VVKLELQLVMRGSLPPLS